MYITKLIILVELTTDELRPIIAKIIIPVTTSEYSVTIANENAGPPNSDMLPAISSDSDSA